MTTIAYDGKFVAVDSQTTRDDVISNIESNKIHCIGDKIFVLCGPQHFCRVFAREFELGERIRTKLLGEVGGLMIQDKRVYIVTTHREEFLYTIAEMTGVKCADGSGMEFALAAMDFGLDAIGAVQYSSSRDVYTGGEVRFINVETGEIGVRHADGSTTIN